MDRFKYESEVLKNYFIKNGGFSGISDKEARLYNNLAQAKFKGFGDKPIIDLKAPGGMQTLFYALMGIEGVPSKSAPNGKIEGYAVFLATLAKNKVALSKKEMAYFKQFLEYYGYKTYDDFLKAVNAIKYTDYTLSDTLLTANVYSLLEGRREKEFKEYVSGLKLKYFQQLIVDKADEAQAVLESMLPPIKIADANSQAIVKEGIIIVPSNMKIIWKDLILMATIGLRYRGLYRPQFQLGVLMSEKMTGNLMFLNPMTIMSDEVHRRKFGLRNLLEFWGIKEQFPEVSFSKGYSIYPFYDNGNYTGKEGEVEELYCIWIPPYSIVVDKFMLGYVHPVIPRIGYTKEYQSQYYESGYDLPCILKDGVFVPLPEAITGKVPLNGDFSNLTSNNLGL